MSYHGHDMDHDGKITTKDMAMFHEMMDEDERQSKTPPPNNGGGAWTPLHTIVQVGMILFFGGFIFLLLKGILPLNALTFFLGIGCLGGIAGLLTM